MNYVQILTTATVSGVVSALTVVFVVARLSSIDLSQEKGVDEILLVEKLKPDNRVLPEQCRLSKRLASPGV